MASSCRTNLVHKSVLGLHVFAPFSSRFIGQTPVHTQMQRSHLTSKSSDSGSWVHCPFYINSDVSLYFSNRFAPVPPHQSLNILSIYCSVIIMLFYVWQQNSFSDMQATRIVS